MIHVENLNKNFYVHKKEPGLKGSLKSLFKRQRIEKKALDNLNLDISEGEIIGLIGSNGAGKTTLTKILSGIIHPTSGTVSVMGYNPWDRNDHYRSQMAVIMGQKAQLWWDLPAMDGFLLLKEIYQIPPKDFYNRIEFLSEYLNIKEQLNIQIRKLSLGERMKVELMAALLHGPKVIFLDEPTIGLDLSAQKAVRSFIKEYRKEYNPTMILTSHYMDDIEELCPRISILKEGRKVYDGSLSLLHQKYATNKIISIDAKTENSYEILKANLPKEMGKVERLDRKVIVYTPRDKAMDTTKYILSQLEVQYFNISEQFVGDVIESILSQKGEV